MGWLILHLPTNNVGTLVFGHWFPHTMILLLLKSRIPAQLFVNFFRHGTIPLSDITQLRAFHLTLRMPEFPPEHQKDIHVETSEAGPFALRRE